MATIKKQGRGYKITVSCGYDQLGKQLRQHKTWVPAPGMTSRQVEKELRRQAVLFEEEVKRGKRCCDGSIRFSAFCQLFLDNYARPYLKAKTTDGYERCLKQLLPGLGHMKLQDIRPVHIAALYRNLQAEGMRAKSRGTAQCIIDFGVWLDGAKTSMAALSRREGISLGALRRCKIGQPISCGNARKIAASMGRPMEEVFQVQRDMSPLSPVTVHAYHRVLSAVFAKAVKWGYIPENPTAQADLPSMAGRHATYLDDQDARTLLEKLQDEPIKWRTLVAFDLLSGLRRAELLGLRWRDVDLDRQQICIRQTWNYVASKGCYADTPKNRSSERPLRISKTAASLLLRYKEWQDRQKALLGDAWLDRDGRVFTGDDGQPMFPDSVTKWFHNFAVRNGFPAVHMHSLRHTYASLLLAEGTPLVVVSHNLGHAQVSTTSNIYSHVISAAEAQADQVFDRYADAVGITK